MTIPRLGTFLILLAAMTAALAAPAKQFYVFFGTDTGGSSRGVYVSRLDSDTGRLSAPELAAETPNPTYLAVSPGGKFLYAANGVNTFQDSCADHAGAVSAFAIDPASGHLALLNQKCSGGQAPCHLSVDAAGKVLFVANYGGGSEKSFLLETNGSIGADGTCASRTGHSINPSRQAGAHSHFIGVDPDNRFALVCDLGTDEVVVYPFDVHDATLRVRDMGAFNVPPGSGARHLAFSRDGKFVYVLNELACTVTTFAWIAKTGTLKPVQTIPALPPGVAVLPAFTAAEILVHPAGKFVYATIRGHDSVGVFTTDPQSGRLTLLQNVPAGGKVPRGMGIDPTGRWLVTANQNTGNVVEYAIDPETGKLSATGQELIIGSPMDVKFVERN
jgi:6-phosphogluconolactonase